MELLPVDLAIRLLRKLQFPPNLKAESDYSLSLLLEEMHVFLHMLARVPQPSTWLGLHEARPPLLPAQQTLGQLRRCVFFTPSARVLQFLVPLCSHLNEKPNRSYAIILDARLPNAPVSYCLFIQYTM